MDRRKLFEVKGDTTYPAVQEIINKMEEWEKLWKELQEKHKILESLTEITGITLSRDIEVHVFGDGLNAMSNPFLMPIKGKGGYKTNDQFIEIIIHELIHRFVSSYENNNIKKYWETIKTEYATEAIKTQNHIIVYAVLEIVLGKMFGNEKLKDYIKPINPEYQKAVEIVKQKGADYLIKQFRKYLI